MDQTLHRQPPSLAFFLSLCATCPPQSSHPAPVSTSGEFLGDQGHHRCKHCVQCSFMRSGWDWALCVSLYTHRAQLFTDWLWERSRGAETVGEGGTGGQWINHGSLVHKTSQNVNKERRFLKGDLLIVSPTECQPWLRCLVWEKNEVGRDRTGQSRAV